MTKNKNIYQDEAGNVWSEAFSNDGSIYYYNLRTRESTWSRPNNLTLIRSSLIAPTKRKTSTAIVAPVQLESSYGYGLESEIDDKFSNINNTFETNKFNDDRSQTFIVETKSVSDTGWMLVKLNNGKSYYYNKLTNVSSWDQPDETKGNIQCFTSEIHNRPISAEPVLGTSWYIVLTGDGKHFFYNHYSSESVWDTPEELINNEKIHPLIDKLKQNISSKDMRTSDNSIEDFKAIVQKKLGINEPTELNKMKNLVAPIKVESNISYPISENDKHNTLQDDDEIVNNKNTNFKIDVNHIEELKHKYSKEEKISMFNGLLEEIGVSVFSTYEIEKEKLESDFRYHLLSNKIRKSIFNEYLQNRVESEKLQKHKELEQKYLTFNNFLRSVVKSSKTSYSDIYLRYSSDPRFRSIPKEKEREALFKEYIASLNNPNEIQLIAENNASKVEFFQMLSEYEGIDVQTSFKKVSRALANDSRFNTVSDSELQERWFMEFLDQKVQVEKIRDLEKIRLEREKTSLREREKAVEAERDKTNQNLSKQRDAHVQEKATNDFNEMLNDHIHEASMSWRNAKELMIEDPRWTSTEILGKNYIYKLFDKHLDTIKEKDISIFYQLLESVGAKLSSNWSEIYPLIKLEPICKKLFDNERQCKKEFSNFIKIKNQKIESDFRDLLSQCRLIDHRFLAKIKLIPSLYSDLIDTIQTDSRYLALDHSPYKRQKMIDDYLLEKQHNN